MNKIVLFSGYLGNSPIAGDIILRTSLNSQGVPGSPLVNISDRLVVDAIRRASLTNRPSIVKYPADFFNAPEDHTSSSEEEEDNKKGRKKSKGKVPAILLKS
ncbi:Uncharacterized protein OBRU01_06435 [Operophtera brumata]|uniref:Uncharacterized protein n=1 Tax=Operophtera brumata TaxID=104452 RepID=A0A0L7LL83_OPEBR|nr:Uncharacterized protein OBRU01_06435 [Operophtera brumata]